jgi:hypothetical protein
MVQVFRERTLLGQANGPDVEMIVSGTNLYADYETPEGFSAIYDEALGLFCFAKVVEGRFHSTGVPVTAPPPSGLERHAVESDEVRSQRSEERARFMARRGGHHD